MTYYGINYDSSIQHHGIKGMKWGVRRYQNADGSLTKAGMKRYARTAREQGYADYDSSTEKYYKKTKKGKTALEADPRTYAKEDLTRARTVASEGSNLSRNLKELSRTTYQNRKNKSLDLSGMSDSELREALNRANLERQYNDVFNQPQVSKGREYADKFLSYGSAALATTASALGVALAIKELTGK